MFLRDLIKTGIAVGIGVLTALAIYWSFHVLFCLGAGLTC